ncbi:MAG TPA: 2-oxoacid:acceptor oxidoreductase subunit alpha [Candidatus Thermoplasmatota archaeon]|nr:2-oxoacid:acceptor oxidoreductase subunit alpha [Candidatus Thermoplasmatota archaeon]
MATKEITLRIGGAAGDGVNSTGEIFAKTCSRSDLHVYAFNAYQSVIRGGHVWYQIRAGPEKVHSVGDKVDVVIALNTQTADLHIEALRAGGCLIYDPKKVKVDEARLPEGAKAFPIPLGEIAAQFSKNPIIQNTVALGAAMCWFDAPFDTFTEVVTDQFGHKKAEIIETNVKAAQAGYDYAKEHYGKGSYGLRYGNKRRPLLTGNQALGLGAMAAGCRFYSFYPMTPATSIGQFLAENGPQKGIVVKQCEDEIAVINMAIGAGYAGVRAACGTSGGGFALMAEAMGFAAITETPVVVVNSQRGGPSTGLPTAPEQADLPLMLGAGQGDYPRIILSPRNVQEAYDMMVEAFNLAEKWQNPVIVASDLLLSEHLETVDTLDLHPTIERGALLPFNGNGHSPEAPYLRYKVTPSGVSPRAVPGMARHEYIAGSDEHDEDGTLVSDVRYLLPDAIEVRNAQMEKRMRKLDGVLGDFEKPTLVGPANAPLTIVSWGSTQGAVREAMAWLKSEGIDVNSLEINYVYPFQTKEVTDLLKTSKHILMVEANYTGQMEKLLRQETGIVCHSHLRKYSGEVIWPKEIVEKVKSIVKNTGKTPAAPTPKGGMH